MKTPKSFFKTLLLLILITTIGVFLSGIFYWLSLNNLSKKLSEKEITIANFADKERALDNLQISYTEIKDKIDSVDYAIPKEKEAASLLASIETLASSKGLNVISYEHKTGNKKKKTSMSQTVNIEERDANDKTNPRMNQVEREGELLRFSPEITLTGSYAKVKEFLNEAENLNRLLVIEKINIQKEEAPSIPDNVRVVITTYAYFE